MKPYIIYAQSARLHAAKKYYHSKYINVFRRSERGSIPHRSLLDPIIRSKHCSLITFVPLSFFFFILILSFSFFFMFMLLILVFLVNTNVLKIGWNLKANAIQSNYWMKRVWEPSKYYYLLLSQYSWLEKMEL